MSVMEQWRNRAAGAMLVVTLVMTLSACSTVKGWMGKDEEEEDTPRLPENA